YTQYFNRRNKRTGRLWECRYHSTVVDENGYLWAVSRYIENNPVRAKVVKKPEDYSYSSARTHILGESNTLLKEPLFDKSDLNNYRRFMEKKEDRGKIEEIRRQTKLGKPLGDGGFLATLSEKLDCNLAFRPRGRPPKRATN
ncbi:MAG: transposase, partial [Nitrospirae bacterium]|nr:transposase [Nitrospirota bacterium]